MILVTVSYPAGANTKFDLDYYMNKHIPLLRERWTSHGLTNVQAVRGAGKVDGSPIDFQVMALISFDSMASFQAAAAAHGPEIIGDIPNFTDTQAAVQINEVLN